MRKTFAIDCFATNGQVFSTDYAVVAIDVLRACTTITTAISHGHAVFLAANPSEARDLAHAKGDALLIGEQRGVLPQGFHLQNSPVQISKLHADELKERSQKPPIIMVSSSGVPLILSSGDHEAGYICCLRNISAVASDIAKRHRKIAIVGAGTRSEFRREDQIGCALLGRKLKERGFKPENEDTEKLAMKWSSDDVGKVETGKSADYLRSSQQEHDLHFTMRHFDDLALVPKLRSPNEIIS